MANTDKDIIGFGTARVTTASDFNNLLQTYATRPFDNVRLTYILAKMVSFITSSTGNSNSTSLVLPGDGTNSYTNSSLVGKNLLLVTTGGIGRTSPDDYSFNNVTGTITFTSNISSEVKIQIIYQSPQVFASLASLVDTGDGTDEYQNDDLIDRTVLQVFTDGLIRGDTDYTFDNTTGTITFSDVVSGVINILYY